MPIRVLELAKINAIIVEDLDSEARRFVIGELAVENVAIRILDSSEACTNALLKSTLI